ncbi:hypothetical protein CANINC_002325 [Pichia inconspicua]|uniref:Vacuolar protein sorting-associated protein 1 n=1 Tax=Pichia inconspicua TaxID=52247 RepID=A0A4T0X202_9ASCO|nr:hypothetical protein CANINC_002325 [[Candida] inconspicua]
MDESLIQTINKLQDALAPFGAGSTSPIDLPQITVVGSQSSGKSSVLENIVGREFLPRGTGIVTRRPLILQLINHRPRANDHSSDLLNLQTHDAKGDKTENNADEWGEFLHLGSKKFYNFDEIREEIIKATDSTVGKNAGISAAPINLKIYSPHVLTLTLVDLPGLTKVPVGDQPPDIEKQIREMIMTYISKPNAIILAVNAANQDLANSDGLKLAREVDPEGIRTIGVLTKVDLMDEGTDVINILTGKVIPLRNGYVAVINRGQKDIENHKTIRAALEDERRFFENHPSYSSKAQYCGTPYLAKKLNNILLSHIKATLPQIKAKIESMLKKFQDELNNLGPEAAQLPSSVVLNVITDFCNDYNGVLDGQTKDISSNELSGGARISFVFHEIFKNGVYALDPFDRIKDADIRTIMYNSSGSSPSLFVGTAAFEVLVKQQIKRFEEPALRCISLVFDELVRILSQILAQPEFTRFPVLKEKIATVFTQYLREIMVPTSTFVTDIIHSEECYINTAHPDLLKGTQAVAIVNEKLHPSPTVQVDPKTGKPLKNSAASSSAINVTNAVPADDEKSGYFSGFFGSRNKKKLAAMEAPPAVLRANGGMSDKEVVETEVIKLLISSYFGIVQRTVADIIPKAVMLKLIQNSRSNIQKVLLEKLYADQDLESLVKENEFTVARRKECKKMIQILNNAANIVASV